MSCVRAARPQQESEQAPARADRPFDRHQRCRAAGEVQRRQRGTEQHRGAADEAPVAYGVRPGESRFAHAQEEKGQRDEAVADDHGDPEMLLADLAAAEAETSALRDQLKGILAEALVR